MLDNLLTKVIFVTTGLLLSMTLWAGATTANTKPSTNNVQKATTQTFPGDDW